MLLDPIKELRGHYDYIFLDTAPSVLTTTLGAYMAADYFILSTTPQRFSIAGLEDAARDIQAAIRRRECQTACWAWSFRMWIPVPAWPAYTLILSRIFFAGARQRSAMFETIISRSTVIGEAQRQGKTIFQTDPTQGDRAIP